MQELFQDSLVQNGLGQSSLLWQTLLEVAATVPPAAWFPAPTAPPVPGTRHPSGRWDAGKAHVRRPTWQYGPFRVLWPRNATVIRVSAKLPTPAEPLLWHGNHYASLAVTLRVETAPGKWFGIGFTDQGGYKPQPGGIYREWSYAETLMRRRNYLAPPPLSVDLTILASATESAAGTVFLVEAL